MGQLLLIVLGATALTGLIMLAVRRLHPADRVPFGELVAAGFRELAERWHERRANAATARRVAGALAPDGSAAAEPPPPARPRAPLPRPRPGDRAADAPPVAPHETDPGISGEQSDLLHAITSLVNRACYGDVIDVRRVVKTLTSAADCLGGGLSHLGHRLGEPDKLYGAEIWEPLITAGAQCQAAAIHCGQADAMTASLLAATVGELAQSPRQAPHHSQLNGGN
jgi:hypothetical protein